ncbi:MULTISPECIES: helix-turn-helix transcriptional regulator [unclassified Lysinibacillus]|uniref:helix-turn-helix transcriptional regulator n=1 Tax=unclassified Lysinibacillus TaxID=2636778 RepID=UPI002552D288|nr:MULTISPECIES: helix-turn-helix transcriptional regulator [unclassified Lysinibacillus]MDM5246751.1 helix-turn-helix transcriptional regulator [Lysinibacillus sp. G4S2]
MNLDNRLKGLREQHNYTQDDVADFLNISRQSVSKWELGKGYPDIDNFIKLSDLYEVSLDQLIIGEEKYHKTAVYHSSESNHKTTGDFFVALLVAYFPCIMHALSFKVIVLRKATPFL